MTRRFSVLAFATLIVLSGCADAITVTNAFKVTAETGKATWDAGKKALALPSMVQDQKANEDASQEAETTQFVGSRITISGGSTPLIEGVGLVTGLDGTGGDVPPSSYRRTILDDMRKRQVPNPERLLQSPSTAVVVIRAYLPPLAKKGDRLDVQVVLPEGSDSTSLRGGWLLPCKLYEQGYVAGRGKLRDDEAAIATGPILLSPSDHRDLSNAGVVRRGSIPGGGKYIGESRVMSLNLRGEYRSVRMAKRVADYVGRRFHGFDEYGIRKPLAEAKTDTRIEMQIPEVYRDNFPRFLRVVQKVAVGETPIETRIRIERLREDLLDPRTAEDAAIQLEAIGKDATVVLREAVNSDTLICRFQAAAALAYLGDDSGVHVLGEAASEDRALRVWSLLAMSALDGGEAIPQLVDLLDEESVETRYGAVRALSIVDPQHPAIRGEEITDNCLLRIVDSTGEPLVHLTKSQKCEITVFGSEQQFHLPLAARAGSRILVVGDATDNTVRITKFTPGGEDEKRVVTPRVADVLLAAAELGASYPDLVGMLLEAEQQHNLLGPIAIDALPQAGRIYTGGAFSTGIGDEDESLADVSSFDEAIDTEAGPEPAAAVTASDAPQRDNAGVSADRPEQRVTAPVGFAPMAEPTSEPVQPAVNTPPTAPAESAAPFLGGLPAQAEPGLVR